MNIRARILAQMAFETLIDHTTLHARVRELARQIDSEFKGEDLILLCVLKGAMYFTSDLSRALSMDHAIDVIQISSYGNRRESSGVITILKEPQLEMKGRSVLIVEDIVDTGLSMSEVYKYIEKRGASKVRVVTCLDKPASRRVDFKPDYVGFTIEPVFVIGYGLDYAEKYRNLDEIQIYKE